jgi:hypothetical protein
MGFAVAVRETSVGCALAVAGIAANAAAPAAAPFRNLRRSIASFLGFCMVGLVKLAQTFFWQDFASEWSPYASKVWESSLAKKMQTIHIRCIYISM